MRLCLKKQSLELVGWLNSEVLVTKSDELSLLPESYMVEENQYPKVVP